MVLGLVGLVLSHPVLRLDRPPVERPRASAGRGWRRGGRIPQGTRCRLPRRRVRDQRAGVAIGGFWLFLTLRVSGAFDDATKVNVAANQGPPPATTRQPADAVRPPADKPPPTPPGPSPPPAPPAPRRLNPRCPPTAAHLPRHPAEVKARGVSPDGKRIVSAAFDEGKEVAEIKVWTGHGRRATRLARPHLRRLQHRFQPGRDADRYRELRRDGEGLRFKDGKNLRSIPFARGSSVYTAAFSPVDQRIATVSSGGISGSQLKVWDAATGDAS